MASIYFREKRGTGLWWIKARSAHSRALVRASLQTPDPAMAALIRKRIALELELRRPEYANLPIPQSLLSELELEPPAPVGENGEPEVTVTPVTELPQPNALPIAEAVSAYYRHCAEENSKGWLKNKISYLRAFFGSAMVDAITKLQSKQRVRGYFKGRMLGEMTGVVMKEFLDGKDIGKKTKRHYREMFHDFFAVLMRYGLYTPVNLVYPNPVVALPSYLETSRHRIIFLNGEQTEEQYRTLAGKPALDAAVRIMIGAGLRRAECLWLNKEAFAPDLSYMSVVNREDEDSDTESSLKTGSRPVTIIPALREFLQTYLPQLKSEWLVPSPTGMRWDKDNFSRALRKVNQAAKLSWTCNQYRHTFATSRARDGWSLFRIAKEMGNSQAIVERYYAAFVRPEWQNPPRDEQDQNSRSGS
ncbi:hypothetical protein BH09VER1_BH09VER1_53310 [soil metagenome]